MGIINCTPDSFHVGSRASTCDVAVKLAIRLAEEGADILDFGGESTRPGSESVAVELERDRVIPVIREVAKRLKVQISIDTSKAAIAVEALDSGATIINDITALRGDPAMAKAALKADRVILMHMLGDSPMTMQLNPSYKDCLSEVFGFLQGRLKSFVAAGGRAEQVIIDPGIGFGKTLEHNLTLIKGVDHLSTIAPVLLGVSRKSMFGKIFNDNGAEDRLAASLSIASWACFNGVSMLRVHDVLETRRTLDVLQAVSEAP